MEDAVAVFIFRHIFPPLFRHFLRAQQQAGLIHNSLLQQDTEEVDQARAADPRSFRITDHIIMQAAVICCHPGNRPGNARHPAGNPGTFKRRPRSHGTAVYRVSLPQGHLPVGADIQEQPGPVAGQDIRRQQAGCNIPAYIPGHTWHESHPRHITAVRKQRQRSKR